MDNFSLHQALSLGRGWREAPGVGFTKTKKEFLLWN